MGWGVLSFLGEPWFVLPWNAIGVLGVLYVMYDMRTNNTVLKPAISWGWPIIVFFFSVVGLALYFLTARAPGIGAIKGQKEKQRAHDQYEESVWRRVNGAVIHCVAGDGLGIMTAMVVARAGGLAFWQEFWFEYVVGFAFGLFIFQRKSMAMMTDSVPKQLWMAFRAEFFSMITVMGGMGAVMTYVTPQVVTAQPKPLTYAFWGFGMFGLLVGFVATFPMNWLMLKIGWKHGMGGMEGARKREVHSTSARVGIFGAMVALGVAALVLPAWLTDVRESAPVRAGRATLAVAPATSPGPALFDGIRASLDRATDNLRRGDRGQAATAIDEALRASVVGAHSAPGSFYSALEQVWEAKIALQQGDETRAVAHLTAASGVLRPADGAVPPVLDPREYRGARVLDPRGAIIGEVDRATGDSLDLVLGGWRDVWGVLDLSAERRVSVPVGAAAFGPPTGVGVKFVAVPTEGVAPAQR